MTLYKKGSALIVVLGLMAFLSISALAFAAYMRYSRVPSSYTRRTSAARNLVKGALMRAIDAMDRAVNDNPHPNLNGPGGFNGEGNIWLDRVYTGVASDALVAESDSVSPLSLEALAYIPPYLVNTVRWYSRHTPTAKWKTLDYDMGRYVYCAVDISDYLDVNRLFADVPRSSAPHTRFSLSYLFDDDGAESYKNPVHTGPGKETGAWDTWMENFRKVNEKTREIDFKQEVPFVSIADFNMALGKRGKIPPLLSPFCEFVGNNNLDAFDNTSYAEGGKTYADLRRMTLATDGLFPRYQTIPGHPDVKAHDLNDANNQPFPMDYLKQEKPSFLDSFHGEKLNDAFKNSARGYDRLSGLGCAALRDYLDTDHIPLSLAIPTTERVPMICGIEMELGNGNLQLLGDVGRESLLEVETEPLGILRTNTSRPVEPKVFSSNENSREVGATLKFRLSSKFAQQITAGYVGALTVFPFSHADESDSNDFGLDGRFSLFFSEGQVPLRPPVTVEGNFAEKVPHLVDKDIAETSLDSKEGLINVKLDFGDKIGVRDLEYPAKDASGRVVKRESYMANQTLVNAFKANDFLRVTIKWRQEKVNDKWTPTSAEVFKDIENGGTHYLSGIEEAHCSIPAIKWSENCECTGTDKDMSNDDELKNFLIGGGSKHLVMKGAVWLRVFDYKDQSIVDMVPACLGDDAVHLGVSSGPKEAIRNVGASFLGVDYPLMLFETGLEFDFSLAGFLNAYSRRSNVKFKVSPEKICVSDPRYNHAPEHWYKASRSLTRQNWLAENHSELGGRNGDIFMATSDSGYMQSKYELMFIPRFTNLKEGGGENGWYEAPSDLRYSIPASFDETLNKSLVWKTYCPFPDVFPDDYLVGDRDDFAAFDALPWTNDGSNFKMTPYSDNLNAFSGVFANTPIDWKRASSNELDDVTYYFGLTAKEFNSKYAYNEWTSETRLAWEDVKSFALRYMGLVRREGELSGNWKQAWQDMDWFGEKGTLCGVELNDKSGKFWSADRKFLYGFWRDCIEPKQQLYLIFVRAEPMMMGVGDLRKMPPQLGARAVGLVWRDPAATGVNNGYPHRTRLLFYRQFE